MRGFSLLEVLIALFVIAFGLLGLAQLQAIALRNNYAAFLQSAAATQLYSGYERFQSASSASEIPLWNEINASILPHGKGEYQHKAGKISICWQGRCLKT